MDLAQTLESSASCFLSLKAKAIITKQLNLFLEASDTENLHVPQVIYSIA